MAVQDVAEIARRLLHVPLFEGLSLDTLAQIVSLSYPKEANAGEFFFNEGDQADEFLVLTAGRVKLTQLTPDGQQIVLRLIGPGDAFGGVGAFGDPTYPISAEAVETASALAWNSATMRQLLETQNQIALNALRFVANRYPRSSATVSASHDRACRAPRRSSVAAARARSWTPRRQGRRN